MKNIKYIFCILLLSSCYKSDRTKATPEIFIGEWQLSHSVSFEYDKTSDNYIILDTILPSNNAIINVKKNGNIVISEDGIKMATIKSKYIGYTVQGPYLTTYRTPSKSLNIMNGVYSFISMFSYLDSDTITVFGYPYYDESGSYSNEIANHNINTRGVVVYNFFTRK